MHAVTRSLRSRPCECRWRPTTPRAPADRSERLTLRGGTRRVAGRLRARCRRRGDSEATSCRPSPPRGLSARSSRCRRRVRRRRGRRREPRPEEAVRVLRRRRARRRRVRISRVRHRFRDDVVGRDLDPLGQLELGRQVELDRDRERRASVFSACPSPPSARIAGWIPRAISRNSSNAVVSSSAARMSVARCSSRSAGTACAAARSSRTSVTRRCCVPSCRSRSIRLRVASAVATIRARDAFSSARLSAFAIAVATSSVKSASRASVLAGSGSGSVDETINRAPKPPRDDDRNADGRTDSLAADGARDHPSSPE